MNDTSPEASIQRFVDDLKRIREDRGVSHADIQEATRVSGDVLNDFESGALFQRSSFNRVYLRSLAKSYAGLVGIEPTQRVLDHLQAALDNRYTNELAVEELDEEPLSIKWPDETSADSESDENTPASIDSTPFDEVEPATADDTGAQRWSSGAATDTTSTEGPASPPSSASHESAGQGAGAMWQPFIIGAVLLLVTAGLIWGMISLTGNGQGDAVPETTETEESASPVDTTAPSPDEATAPSNESSNSVEVPPVVLGQTIYATLWADGGNVNGVRIQRDADLRRPYWIESGDVVVLPFQERIVIEEQFDQFSLFINEREMPLEPLDAQGRRVLSRTDLEVWADTTQTPPAEDIPAASDTLRTP